MIKHILYLSLLFWLSGCAYKIKTEDVQQVQTDHWLYSVIPRHRSQIRWYDVGHWTTWMLFGNDDDGIFGEEPTANYHPEWPNSVCKSLAWNFRNPLHNFCFYVIGTAYWDNSEFVLLKVTPNDFAAFEYHELGTTTFAGDNSSLFLAFHGWKPFISACIRYSENYKTDFYLGWRCRGNFGIKCHPLSTRKEG